MGAQLPPKVTGEHRWVVTTGYTMTAGQIEAVVAGSRDFLLDHENRFALVVACWDCHQAWDDSGEPCLAAAWQDDQAVPAPPAVDDPHRHHVDSPPAGSGAIDLSTCAQATDAYGFGAQAVVVGEADDPEQADIRLVVSVVGMALDTGEEVHHLYVVQPRMVGLWAAQMARGILCLGPAIPEANEVFQQYMVSDYPESDQPNHKGAIDDPGL